MVITFFLLIKDDLKSADLVKILKPQCDRSRLFFFFIKLSLNPILSGWDKVSHFRHTQGPLFQGTYPTVVYLGQSHHPWNGAKRGKYIQFSGLQYAEEPARFSSYGTLFLWPYWDAGRYDPTRFESFRPVTTRSKKGPPPVERGPLDQVWRVYSQAFQPTVKNGKNASPINDGSAL